MKKVAHTLSIIFHPLLLPTFVFITLAYLYPYFNTPYTANYFSEICTFIFVCTFIFPSVSIFAMYKWQVISDVVLSNKHERPYPMALISLMYLVFTKLLFEKIGIDPTFITVMYFIGFLILFAGVITYFWKISAHTLGVGGICGFLIELNTQVLDKGMLIALMVAIVISGLVMTARLLLKAHTPSQVYIGFLIGTIFGFSLSAFYI